MMKIKPKKSHPWRKTFLTTKKEKVRNNEKIESDQETDRNSGCD